MHGCEQISLSVKLFVSFSYLIRENTIPMKILVTGGAGFISSAVVRHIIRNTQDAVINLDGC